MKIHEGGVRGCGWGSGRENWVKMIRWGLAGGLYRMVLAFWSLLVGWVIRFEQLTVLLFRGALTPRHLRSRMNSILFSHFSLPRSDILQMSVGK